MTQIFDQSNHSFANKFLVILILLLVITSSSSIVLGTKTGELNKKVFKPVNDKIQYIYKRISESDKAMPVYVPPANNVDSNSSSSANIEINNNDVTTVPQAPQRPQNTNWNWPVYNTPTPNPTIIEWNRQFELKQAEMQREYEESKQKVCAAMPDAPGCH